MLGGVVREDVEESGGMALLSEVFGVSSKPILSYVERDDVDTRFREGLASDKQIIVYGSSKQGKTALVSKYLPYKENILVRLTPKTTVAGHIPDDSLDI